MSPRLLFRRDHARVCSLTSLSLALEVFGRGQGVGRRVGRRFDRRRAGGARLQPRHCDRQVRGRGLDRLVGHAVGGDPFAGRHVEPGPAARRHQARGAARRRARIPSATRRSSTSGASSSPFSCSRSARASRSTRASRRSSIRTRSPTRTSTTSCSRSRSCSKAYRPGRRSASSTSGAAPVTPLAALRASKDPALFTVVLEDIAALAGLFVALIGIAIADVFGSTDGRRHRLDHHRPHPRRGRGLHERRDQEPDRRRGGEPGRAHGACATSSAGERAEGARSAPSTRSAPCIWARTTCWWRRASISTMRRRRRRSRPTTARLERAIKARYPEVKRLFLEVQVRGSARRGVEGGGPAARCARGRRRRRRGACRGRRRTRPLERFRRTGCEPQSAEAGQKEKGRPALVAPSARSRQRHPDGS